MQHEIAFIHHVFFWLANAGNEADRNALVAGLQKLTSIKSIQQAHIGRPAATNREVIDNSYDVSWMLLFKTKEDQDQYQDDPVHLEFVKTCAHLWQKVVVYDSEKL